MEHVDAYCERLTDALWAEPLNAVSNLAFLIAAALLWRLRPVAGGLRALPVLLALVGLASLAFHTWATRLTGALDSGFIALFVLYYPVVFAHWFLGVRWSRAWLAVPAFVVFAAATSPLAALMPGGSYLAPWLALVVITVVAAVRGLPWRELAVAAALFAGSLALRTLDQPLCGVWPSGTHHAWHVLNAAVLFLVARAAIRRERPAGRT
ncbi:hypothetical protein ABZ816_38360 [Actinosynnema sp. NPDC047251]|uniref:Putative membrane protein n=1 Tax=Saccharothrix espanaensis (strain ATCC 51144 / DSM 44229 / JCM 9112 / NBRC 15066 / NRRL 15764) TaxID=1179773 RepID=K0JUP3_SACES|nr:hypothetical protein [Saccharothrix espanaensis]CCH29227.1 putative membrane protein [Saccharothrix espanaensis DSM 44229]